MFYVWDAPRRGSWIILNILTLAPHLAIFRAEIMETKKASFVARGYCGRKDHTSSSVWTCFGSLASDPDYKLFCFVFRVEHAVQS